jgi:hypothetical protein
MVLYSTGLPNGVRLSRGAPPPAPKGALRTHSEPRSLQILV